MGKRKKKSGYWVYQYALQTTPTNEMLSFHFSRLCLSQSQGSRREREFCSLNLEFRDENEIFLSISQGSRRDRDIFFQVSCFEMGLRDEINLILTRIFEIEKSRHALTWRQVFVSHYLTFQDSYEINLFCCQTTSDEICLCLNFSHYFVCVQ